MPLGHQHTPIPGLQPETWSRMRDVITIALIPALVWVMTQTQKNAEMAYEIMSLKTQVEENKSKVGDLRDAYNGLNLQIVEVRATLKSISDGVTALEKKLDEIDKRTQRLSQSLSAIPGCIPQGPVYIDGGYGVTKSTP